ncbi:MAG: hypothetical protein L0Y72_05495 [Gemmataceae bacterium]|nr:hypothetical protein [Gemmataceae bacterium]MCI0738478.1 hypothetical protein [Gemmataceae bacterium]
MHADYQAAVERAVCFDFIGAGLVEVSGPDARAFLHNLCTNDVKNLPEGFGCEAFFTTHKARVVAHGWIQHEKGVFWIDVVAGLAEKLVAHLDHFLVSEQVGIVNRSAEWSMLRVCGPKAENLADLVGLNPLQQRLLEWAPGKIVRARRFPGLSLPCFDFFSPRDERPALLDWLTKNGVVMAPLDVWHTLRVEAGLPEYGKDIDENRLVMEVGRTAQAISYTKGCFLGQEPIVMARDRGQVNRTLLGLKLEGPDPVAAGSKVLHEGNEVGQTTSSVFSPGLNQAIALAYLRRGSQTPGTELLLEAGRKAIVSELPFKL